MTESRAKIMLSAIEGPLTVPAETLAAEWSGPAALDPQTLTARIRQALDEPLDYPPLGRIVVPGDHVVLVLEPGTPDWPRIVSAVIERLTAAGVELQAISLLGSPGQDRPQSPLLPPEVAWLAHTPEDRAELAYLSNTTSGRRVYLNRHLAEADVVIPIGWLRDRQGFGLFGPWFTIFPETSDEPTRTEFHRVRPARQDSEPSPVKEAVEVNWHLGARFQVAVLPGASGTADVLAGDVEKLVQAAKERFEKGWRFTAKETTELLVLGLGDASAGLPVSWEELTRTMVLARSLVEPGGRMVLACPTLEPPGAALRFLAEMADTSIAAKALKEFKDQPDYRAAVRLARFDRTGPIGLLSQLPDDVVENLGFVPIRDADELEKMLQKANASCIVNRAELTRISLETTR